MQSDGYSGYDSAVDFWNENHPEHKLTHSNCNIHARRYFADAVKATGSKTADCRNFELFKNRRSHKLLPEALGQTYKLSGLFIFDTGHERSGTRG